jgi:hypothetical protein
MTPFIIAGLVLVVLAIPAVAWGKTHARRLQRDRRIRIDKFKLKSRYAEIELVREPLASRVRKAVWPIYRRLFGQR